MAPRRPQSRTLSRSKANPVGDLASAQKISTTSNKDSSLPTTKASKRTQRHRAFVSRITKPSKTTKKLVRRRPRKKITASLSDLVDALPAHQTIVSDTPDAVEQDPAAPGRMRIRNVSLKSRPGAQKKRAALEALEREWFAKNLASMSAKSETPAAASVDGKQAHDRSHVWGTLREHVAANLQRMQEAKIA